VTKLYFHNKQTSILSLHWLRQIHVHNAPQTLVTMVQIKPIQVHVHPSFTAILKRSEPSGPSVAIALKF